ncbi:MAG: HAMP domain-containing histidine kinase [Pirellulales bacterium]|nr:HAMP domain-containing histidine kinase [Pirellulales bacterium]
MRLLPFLAARGKSVSLPMADASAESLMAVLLGEAGEEAAERLSAAMKSDPPLVLWTACAAWQLHGLRPLATRELAAWLSRHASAALQWSIHQRFTDESFGPLAAKLAVRLDADFQAGELIALLSRDDSDVERERALLLGLLGGAEEWLQIASEDKSFLRGVLPDWLAESASTRPRAVCDATAILEGRSPPPSGLDLEEIRRRAEALRLRWLAPGPSLINLLPTVALRMARLASLELEFHAAVENEKLEAMAEFAAGAGHEINNPLAIIGGRAQLLLAEETDPERRRELAVVNAQVKRAHEMIADMRLFARPPQPEPKRFDLAALADELAVDVAAQAADRKITVSRNGDCGPLEIEADPAQLAVALRALCKNSLELMAYDGRLEIGISALDDLHVQIRISDNGPGMTTEQRRHAFDPFYSARQAGRGLGLGLSKCWRIVTKHGGKIDVESRPDQGTAFTITLPRRRGDLPA